MDDDPTAQDGALGQIRITDLVNLKRAQQLSESTGWPLVQNASSSKIPLLLEYSEQGVRLSDLRTPQQKPVYVDFTSSSFQRRLRTLTKKDPFVKAFGGVDRFPKILDATAGLGTDCISLAYLGYEVCALEKNPIVHELLVDGVERFASSSKLGFEVTQRVRILNRDAAEFLESSDYRQWHPNTIYLDPMYSEKKKTALQNKEMRTLRELLGSEETGAELFHIAYNQFFDRLVVKRPIKADTLGGRPEHQFRGRSTRYDLYVQRRTP